MAKKELTPHQRSWERYVITLEENIRDAKRDLTRHKECVRHHTKMVDLINKHMADVNEELKKARVESKRQMKL